MTGEIYTPREEDRDPKAEDVMRMGRVDLDPNNDLRDPWFHTAAGKRWLAERGEG